MSKWENSGLAAAVLSIILLLSMTGLLIAIAVMPDFVPPEETFSAEGNEPFVGDKELPIWDASFEDLIVYLQQKGVICEEYELISEGVATDALYYGGVELYWWDVDNLVEGSDEYICWTTMKEEGYMLIFGQYVFVPIMNGPFGMYIQDGYAGDSEALKEAFLEFTGGETP